jgi:hypothetical protein
MTQAMLFGKTTMSQFTQLELFSYSLKDMNVKFNIFPRWAARSPDSEITEPAWSVLETKSEQQIPTSNISKSADRSGRAV